ncbi:hypothetical protein JQ543_11820 [Bradyrhizobium diazoefficiens]|nr:hypothetical protein [Bradyrhizobium diazoefficiens]MBR0848430.1 hypothetical protein [Bradyrhizobium diazoefficiens]
MLSRILLVAISLLIPGALRAEETPAEKAGFAPRLMIYLAKGAPDACGPGCDRWIAIEGEIDQGAAVRIRRFLAGVKDTQRPIYLYSPGGNVEQSYAIGRLLRSRKAIARVGRTMVTACASGTQVDAACLKAKGTSGEIEAELTTRLAMCNSACGYLFLGATSREVAPDAALAVHSSRLVFVVQGRPPPALVAEARRRRMAVADRERAVYVTAMGISRELDDLIRTVKYESLHVLTRSELYRFGIDTRPLAETTWRLEKATQPFVTKIAMLKENSGSSFRMMEWRLYCEKRNRVPLIFAAEIDEATVAKSTVMMTANADETWEAGGSSVRAGKYAMWSGTVEPGMVKAMLASRQLQVRETRRMSEEKADTAKFEIDLWGLPSVWTQLGTSCPPAIPASAPIPALPTTSGPNNPWMGLPMPKVAPKSPAAPAP